MEAAISEAHPSRLNVHWQCMVRLTRELGDNLFNTPIRHAPLRK